jgi:arylsulfatase A-like enzyme
MATDRPNIVLFVADQWRGDVLGHMGNPGARTPALDAFARESAVSFRHAYCQNPVCTPSRCSFLSGWYPHVRGHRTMHHMLRPDEPMLLRTLKNAGYSVWWGGKNDVVPAQQGFADCCSVRFEASHRGSRHDAARWRGTPDGDSYYSFWAGRTELDPDGRDSDIEVVDAAVQRIEGNRGPEPFCLYVALGFPHPPYGVEEPWYSGIDRAAIPERISASRVAGGEPRMRAEIRRRQRLEGWSEERWTELRATYYAMCARVDAQFGRVLEALRRRGLHDDTAIAFFADHGDYTGDYGLVEKTQNTFEDCLVRVPLLVKPPAGVPVRPRVSDALVELLDVPATVLDLAGIAPRHAAFGRSLRPVLAGRETHRDAVFCEGGRLPDEEHTRERESPGSMNPENLYYPRLSLQATDGVAHGKAVMCRTRTEKYVYRLEEPETYHDLETDPGECINRALDPECRLRVRALRERVLRFMVETADAVPLEPDRRW